MKNFMLLIVLFTSGCANQGADTTKPIQGLIVTTRGCDRLMPIEISCGSCCDIYYGDGSTINYCGVEPEFQFKDYCTAIKGPDYGTLITE